MVTRAETKMVTGKINGQDVTVPQGTTILEACRSVGIEVPNLCYQPLMRPWGSCRICTVEILGPRGGLIESCATPLGEGMEVDTHSAEVTEARQFILQMYLIDHALDCPTCDKSGECYLQDNTYLQNVNANPYRRPKFTQPYKHFSELIDYKWDRCIMCNRCTRVCDEMIGVTAIESTARSAEASVSPAFGEDLSNTLCTSCGMCIAVCPVGALTDRHFAHHPWELDATETICGFCDVGCTINVESNKGVVRRITNLWDRGTNHGYVCHLGKWGHERVQHPDRLAYPTVRDETGFTWEVTWEDAVESVAETLAHYQGDQFAALASPDSTNEEIFALQQFTRAAMNTNNIDRLLTIGQQAVETATTASLGRDVSSTNNLEEMFTDVKCAMVVGPNIGTTAPVASYWLYHSRIYREAKTIVISQDDFPLAWRGELYLKPKPGTTAILLNGIAAQVIEQGLAAGAEGDAGFAAWKKSLSSYSLARVSEATGVDADKISAAAALYASGGAGAGNARDGVYPPSVIFQTAAHIRDASDDDAGAITTACNNLALLTGNFGRPGGGVVSPRGSANAQGAADLGAQPGFLPGGAPVTDAAARARFEQAWMNRWAGGIKTSNGMQTVKTLPATAGIGVAGIAAAIESGAIKAMVIEDSVDGLDRDIDPALLAALPKLEFLVVIGAWNSPLAKVAHMVLPKALYLEKDGTFTSLDRTVQRLRAAVPPTGESKSTDQIVGLIGTRMGYEFGYRSTAAVMDEIGMLVPDYAGVTWARLERKGLNVPVTSFSDPGTPVLVPGADGRATLSPKLVVSAAD